MRLIRQPPSNHYNITADKFFHSLLIETFCSLIILLFERLVLLVELYGRTAEFVIHLVLHLSLSFLVCLIWSVWFDQVSSVNGVESVLE